MWVSRKIFPLPQNPTCVSPPVFKISLVWFLPNQGCDPTVKNSSWHRILFVWGLQLLKPPWPDFLPTQVCELLLKIPFSLRILLVGTLQLLKTSLVWFPPNQGCEPLVKKFLLLVWAFSKNSSKLRILLVWVLQILKTPWSDFCLTKGVASSKKSLLPQNVTCVNPPVIKTSSAWFLPTQRCEPLVKDLP